MSREKKVFRYGQKGFGKITETLEKRNPGSGYMKSNSDSSEKGRRGKFLGFFFIRTPSLTSRRIRNYEISSVIENSKIVLV